MVTFIKNFHCFQIFMCIKFVWRSKILWHPKNLWTYLCTNLRLSVDTEGICRNNHAQNQFNVFRPSLKWVDFFPFSLLLHSFSSFLDASGTKYRMTTFWKVKYQSLRSFCVNHRMIYLDKFRTICFTIEVLRMTNGRAKICEYNLQLQCNSEHTFF